MAEVISIASFDFDLDRLNKSIDDYQKRLFDLQKEQKRYSDQTKALDAQMKKLAEAKQLLTKSGQEESKAYKDVEVKIKSVNAQQEQLYKNQRNIQIETGKVRSEYNRATKAQQAMRDSMGNLLSSTEAYEQALSREIKTKEDAKRSNSELIKLGDQLDLTNEDNVRTLELLNAKIDENTEFIRANSSAVQQQRMNIGNYKQDVTDAVNELNIFNGGLSGFASRASQAGGASTLLSNSLKTATSATVGLTKAMLAFLFSPIGAVLGAIGVTLGLIINYLKNTQSGIDMVTKVTRPLTEIFKVLGDILQRVGKLLVDVFLQPQKYAKQLYDFMKNQILRQFQSFGKILEGIFTLDFSKVKEGFSDLTEQVTENFAMITNAVRGVIDEMHEAVAIGLEIDRITKKIEESEIALVTSRAENNRLLADQRAIMNNTNSTLQEKLKANEEEYRLIQQIEAEEQAILKLKIHQLELQQKIGELTRDDRKEMAELRAQENEFAQKRAESENRHFRNKKRLQNEAHGEAVKQIEAQIQKQREQLDLWITEQGIRAKTLQEQLDLDRQIAQKSIAILDQELKAKKISREKYEAEVLKIRMDLAKQESLIVEENAQRELDLLIKNTDRQLEERKRLNGEEIALIAQQEEAKLVFELTRFEQGLINETEYQANKLAIQEEYLKRTNDLTKQYEEQQRADRLLRNQLETEARLLALEENSWNEFEAKQTILDEQYQLEREKLQEQYDAGSISYENFLQANENLTRQYADSEAEIARLKEQYKLDVASQTFANLATIAGKESAAGKAFAIAQATIDTYKAATSAYQAMSGIPVVGPALGAVAAGAAVAAGIANVKKITSVKTPKTSGGNPNKEVQGFADGGIVNDGFPIFRGNGDNVLITARTGEAILNESQRGFIGNDILNMAGVPGVSPSSNLATQNSLAGNSESLNEMIADAVYRGSLLGTSSGTESGMVQAAENRQIQNQATF